MADEVHAEQRWRRAVERAVAREWQAIDMHQRAAVLHDAVAAELGEMALAQDCEWRIAALLRRAAREREFAHAARDRASSVRARLAAEGVTDDG